MKKTIIYILCVLSVTLIKAQKSEESVVLEKLNLMPIESILDEQGRQIDKATKVLRINRNEHFRSSSNTAN
jgi:hypothetical protein